MAELTRYDSIGVQREINAGFSKMIWRTIDRYKSRQSSLGKSSLDIISIKVENTSKQVVININDSDYRTAFDYITDTHLSLKYTSKDGIEYLMLESESID